MSEQSGDALYHPEKAPDFDYEPGDTLKDNYGNDSYWVVKKRIWDYDADYDGVALPYEMVHKVYEIGDVSGLGYPERHITEADIKEHYEQVSRDEAMEVV